MKRNVDAGAMRFANLGLVLIAIAFLSEEAVFFSGPPVRDPKGKVFARFTSIWRQEAPGVWRIVFDKGSDVCDCGNPPAH